MQLFRYFFIMLCGLLFMVACKQRSPQPAPQQPTEREIRERLIQANKSLLQAEEQRIQEYVANRQWQMTTTGTGLRYWIEQEGSGDRPMEGETVQIRYAVSLLNGDLLYTANEIGVRKMTLGKNTEVSGLDEAIRLLRPGAHAKLILPAHLAHGLVGDGDRIPAKAALVYDLEFLQLINY